MKRIILIGCGASKAAQREHARDLYTGGLFLKRRQHAENSGCKWYIISAKHHLISPDRILEPYDQAMNNLNPQARRYWGTLVVEQITKLHGTDVALEIHAGAHYASAIQMAAAELGIKTTWPTQGLAIGQQLAWYNRY